MEASVSSPAAWRTTSTIFCEIVQGSLEAVRRRAARDEPAVNADLLRLAEGGLEGAKRATTLVQRLLAFSRRQPLDPKPIDVNKLVGAMSDLLRRTLGETIISTPS